MIYIDTAQTDWTEVASGYRRTTLVDDRVAGTRIVLVQYDSG